MDGLEYVLSTDFQENAARDYLKWDKEWLRYFSIHQGYEFYFYDMSGNRYALSKSLKDITYFDEQQTYHTPLFKSYTAQVWVKGHALVGKTVLEMGCGPGLFGKMCGRIAKQYVGIDLSRLALHIARTASPSNCRYLHMSDVDGIHDLKGTVDTCVGRNFFIHHNYEDSLWILRFLRDLTAFGGLISADFYHLPHRVGEDRRHGARDPLNEHHASALYSFERKDIEDIAIDAGLELLSTSLQERSERHFANFGVR